MPVRGGLNVTDQQAAVVDHVAAQSPTCRVTVVSAGAGSGKTHTTVATVLDRVQAGGASVDQFVLITFTEKAADELRARMERALSDRRTGATVETERLFWQEQQERLAAGYIGTIHGFCRLILRTFGYDERVARESDVTFARNLLQDALKQAVEDALTDEGTPLLEEGALWDEYRLRELVETILEQCRGRGIAVQQMLDRTRAQPNDQGKRYRVAMAELVACAERLYSDNKDEQQCLDPNDLLSRTADLLAGANGPDVVAKLTARYHYLFIDEFQDTDRVQKRIVDAFLGRLAGLLVVGDTKQSIYGWRSADVSLLREIATENAVPILPLSISRRPTLPFLDSQNGLFGVVGERYPDLADPLQPWDGILEPQGGIPPVTMLAVPMEDQRPGRIAATASHILHLLTQQIEDTDPDTLRPVEQGDIAILFRSGTALREYEEGLGAALRGHGVTVRQVGGGLFYQRPEIVDTYRVLRVLLHYPDDTALSLALQTPFFHGVDAARQEQHILQYGSRHGHPLTDWFEATYPRWRGSLDELRGMVRVATVPQILARLYALTSVREHYARLGDRQAAENLEKLRELARHLFRNEQALTLRQFVGALKRCFQSGAEESEALMAPGQATERPHFVRLMTIHAAKGLEFPLVIIPEVQAPLIHPERDPVFLLSNDGLDLNLSEVGLSTMSPRFRTVLQASRGARLEEEMRVFYVAVTRAQHAVTFVGTRGGPPNGPGDDFYSWKDEIRRAWAQLQALGAVVG